MEAEEKIKSSVTFSTKCWENDWSVILEAGFLDKMIKRNNYNFDEKILVINNIKNKKKVEEAALKQKRNGVIDRYFFVEEYEDNILDFFNISRKSFFEKNKDGYLYSICELFEIFYAKTDYLVHFSGDSILEKKYNWIDEGKLIFTKNDNVSVVNPCWDGKFNEVKNESIEEKDNYFLSEGYFSDQCYMIKLKDFKKRIYNEIHPFSKRYPRYAGNLFEKRVDAWMRNYKKQRATLKNISYKHKNWNLFNKLKFKIFNKKN
ncbi:MAG: hypothetical protein U5L76_02520 [Patescibacteria group bacterium]|nr:hypothetical protein [Patescibacteria group bacterium]